MGLGLRLKLGCDNIIMWKVMYKIIELAVKLRICDWIYQLQVNWMYWLELNLVGTEWIDWNWVGTDCTDGNWIRLELNVSIGTELELIVPIGTEVKSYV